MSRKFKIFRINHAGSALQHNHINFKINQIVSFDKYDYNENLSRYGSLNLTYGNSITRALNQLGHDVHEIIFDLEIIQKGWAQEFSFNYNNDEWQIDILTKQINHYKPEILFFQNDLRPFPIIIWQNLKDYFPCVKKIIVHRGVNGKYKFFQDIDLLMCASPYLVELYQQEGVNASLLYHYFDSTIISKALKIDNNHHNLFTFIGSSGYGSRQHTQRYWMLFKMLENTEIELYLNEHQAISIKDVPEFISSIAQKAQHSTKIINELIKVNNLLEAENLKSSFYRALINSQFKASIKNNMKDEHVRIPRYPLSLAYPDRCHSPVYGNDYYRLISDSLISFNMPSDFSQGHSFDLRSYQVPGSGSCLLCKHSNDISNTFKEDVEIVTYKNDKDAVEKVNYLLDNRKVTKSIAIAGQNRVLKDHTEFNRAEVIDYEIQQLFK